MWKQYSIQRINVKQNLGHTNFERIIRSQIEKPKCVIESTSQKMFRVQQFSVFHVSVDGGSTTGFSKIKKCLGIEVNLGGFLQLHHELWLPKKPVISFCRNRIFLSTSATFIQQTLLNSYYPDIEVEPGNTKKGITET